MPRNQSEKTMNLDAALPLGPDASNLNITFMNTDSINDDVVRIRRFSDPEPTTGEVIELSVPRHTPEFDIYHIEDGVDYWYFNRSTAHAVACHINTLALQGIYDSDSEGFSISRLTRTAAERLNFRGEDGQVECNLYDAGVRYGPGFIACSEY